jgi:hypothetical protein
MPNDDVIKSLMDPVRQFELIEKETETLTRLMRETCSEILGEAASHGPLHLERVALDAIAGISAITASALAESGFVRPENLGKKGGRFRCAACRGFVSGAIRGFRRRGTKP